MPELEDVLAAAEHHWDQVGEPEAEQVESQINATQRDLSKLSHAVAAERLDRVQARGAERATGLDRGLGL